LLYAEDQPDFTRLQITRPFNGRIVGVPLPNSGVYLPSGGTGQGSLGTWEKGVQWTLQDEILQEVIYVGQQEHYKLLKETHSPGTIAAMGARKDLTSAGEFGSTLKSLFDPGTKADFSLEKMEKIRGWKSVRAKVKVSQENSDREIAFEGSAGDERKSYSIKAAYQGQAWFDLASGQVIQLQLEALNLPLDFPIARFAWAIDYDLVSIEGKKYWLPVRAELQLSTSSCKALPPSGKNLHTRNLIEFKEYHKFEPEVKILPE
jgi:hypothetical protein